MADENKCTTCAYNDICTRGCMKWSRYVTVGRDLFERVVESKEFTAHSEGEAYNWIEENCTTELHWTFEKLADYEG